MWWASSSEAMLKSPAQFVRLFGALLAALAICGQAGASSKYVLIAEPPIVHAGDTVFLSGSGFPPNTPLTIVTICDDNALHDPKNHLSVGTAGPTTNDAGRLVGVPFQLPPLPDGISLDCRYFPSFAGQGNGPVVPGVQGIARSTQTIDAFNRVPFINAWPKRSGSGWIEQIQTWPGSKLHLKIQYFPSYKVQRIDRVLGWNGSTTLTVPRGAFQGKGTHKAIVVIGTSTFQGREGSISDCRRLVQKPGTGYSHCL